MKTSLIVDETKYDLDFDLIHYEDDNYFPRWKSWVQEEDVLANPLAFFKHITVSSKEGVLDFETLESSLKEKILRKLFSEAIEYKNKETDYLNYHHTGNIPSTAYRNLNFDWVELSKRPVLLKVFVDKTGEELEIRQSGEKNKYIKKDKDDEILRDENGNALYLSDEEVASRDLPVFDTSVYAFNKKGECIGYTSDEFGADGVWVLPEYQKRGIGSELLSLHRSQFKDSRKMGQMTYAGTRLVLSLYRKNNS